MKIHTPAMKFKDEASAKEWDEGVIKNQDPYGAAVYRYASEWATRMDAAFNEKPFDGVVAKKLSHDADNEGITGFMYGCAVSMLAAWWIMGEDLRRWHNLDTQIGNEGERANESGGVLNPAVLNIG